MNPTLIEYFAAHIPTSTVGITVEACSELCGPMPSSGTLENYKWHANVDAKLRFIRAKAMVEEAERIRATESTRQADTRGAKAAEAVLS